MAGRISYYGNIVKDGLVLDLDAAKRDSYPGTGTAWNDISGFRNNGVLTNGPTFNSDNGGSIVFDGSNDFVNLGTSIQNYSIFTTSFWINYNVFNSSHKSPIGDNSQEFLYHVLFLSGIIYIGFSSNFSGLSYTGAAHNTINVRNWYNFVITKNSSNLISFYQNSILLGTQVKGGNVNVNTIGKGYVYDNAKISNLLFYNRALSATEVLQNYNATKGRYL
jgi:hypothetical protein